MKGPTPKWASLSGLLPGKLLAQIADAFIARPHPAERLGLRETTHKRHRGWGTINRERRKARASHVLRVAAYSFRAKTYFAVHGHKPPRATRVQWTRDIAASVR